MGHCHFCDAYLDGPNRRHVTIDTITYMFCPAQYAPLAKDCVNEFLKNNQQSKVFDGVHGDNLEHYQRQRAARNG